MYLRGHKMNAHDGIYMGIRDEKQRKSVTVDFKPVQDSKIGELAARFDLVLGFTPRAEQGGPRRVVSSP